MRHHPSCWNKVLAKLGFRRVPGRYKRQAAFSGRLSRIESLEARQMLTVTVNTLADVVDSDPLTMSLREAIAHPTDNSIDFDQSLNGGRIVLTQGSLSITKPITISGPGADKLAIDAAGASRVMSFGGGLSNVMMVSGLTITGGNATGGGGGVYNAANLTLDSVDVSGNVTDTAGGGIALQSGSKLTVRLSSIHNNRAGNYGGGIGGHINAADSVTIVQSTISNNVAFNGGGVVGFPPQNAPR